MRSPARCRVSHSCRAAHVCASQRALRGRHALSVRLSFAPVGRSAPPCHIRAPTCGRPSHHAAPHHGGTAHTKCLSTALRWIRDRRPRAARWHQRARRNITDEHKRSVLPQCYAERRWQVAYRIPMRPAQAILGHMLAVGLEPTRSYLQWILGPPP